LTSEQLQLSEVVESLGGIIDRVIYHNEANGFSVLRLRLPHRAEPGVVVGNAALVRAGDHVECRGQWVNDRVRGMQFKAQSIEVVPPTTLDGIERYLCSGMVPGIGPHLARLLIETFRERVFDVIEREPERLSEVPGIGAKRRAQILASWADQRAVRDIMVFLQSHGIGPGRAVRIYKTYGPSAIARVRENPYRLARDVEGIGFKIADELARQLGIAPDSPMRARAAVHHVLQELASGGHCAALRAVLVTQTSALLGVDANVVETALQGEIDNGALVLDRLRGEPVVYLRRLYEAEQGVARHLQRLVRGEAPWHPIDVEAALPWVAQRTGLTLSPSQQEAVRAVVAAKVAVITGGPGVGKTTIVNTILRIVRAKGAQVVLCAPTGRAAKRLSESTGLEAKTIHRLLEFDPSNMDFSRGADEPLDADLVVVDESSMVDIVLMKALLEAVPDGAGLLLVGDVDQLPSVGPGSVLADIIASQCITTARLTEIFRQAASSRIIVNAHRINHGEMPLDADPGDTHCDFYFLPAETPQETHTKLMQVVTERIPQRFALHPLRDVQVLTPMNKGGLGTRSLNVDLQAALNKLGGPRLERFGSQFGLGDKVIQTVNNYDKEVFNGDIGFIEFIDPQEGKLRVNFDGRGVEYALLDLDELALAYATTIHKSQGSEYPAVVIPLSTQHYTMLERNLLYTAVTRGKRLVVIIGQPKALRIAVGTVRAAARLSNLVQRLRQTAGKDA